MEQIKHIHIRVSGKVQGVFFRASTKEKADELGIYGFVRNEPNGDVYIEAEGVDMILDEFIAWCSVGPTRAMVEKIETASGEVMGFSRFDIRR